jgi:hypothetical protein
MKSPALRMALITVAILFLLEGVARWFEPPRAEVEMQLLIDALIGAAGGEGTGRVEAEKCVHEAKEPPPDRYSPGRPEPLGRDLNKMALGSYYSPDSLMMHTWAHGAFQPESPTGAIAVYGSSTIAGDGLRCPENTIPSQLQQLLSRDVPATIRATAGSKPRVDNLGQSAFVSYNQFLLLLSQLRNGYRPHIVVFYQGHNDALQRVLSASPHFNYNGYSIGATGKYSIRHSIRNSLLGRSALLRRLSGEQPIMSNLFVEGDDYKPAVFVGSFKELTQRELMERRANAVASDMQGQAAMLGELSSSYGFELVVFNYPSVFSKKVLSESEMGIVNIARKMVPEAELALSLTQTALHERFRTPPSRVHYSDLRNCFGESTETVFRDVSHLNAKGNEIIAGCIYKELSVKPAVK